MPAAPKQIDKFRDLAREPECDEARFDEQLTKLAKHRPGEKPVGTSE